MANSATTVFPVPVGAATNDRLTIAQKLDSGALKGVEGKGIGLAEEIDEIAGGGSHALAGSAAFGRSGPLPAPCHHLVVLCSSPALYGCSF